MDESESQQSQSDIARTSSLDQASAAVAAAVAMRAPSFDGAASAAGGVGVGAAGGITAGPAGALARGTSLQQLVRPTQVSGIQGTGGLRNSNMNQCRCS